MNHEEKSATETTAVEDVFHSEPISRRTLVKAGATAMGLAVFGVSSQPTAQAAGEVAAEAALNDGAKFMAASHFLIQHRLSSGVGARMAGILHTRIPTLDADLDVIIRTAKERNAKVVEDFFDALPDGQVKDSAHQIIFGWDAGVVDASPTAEVFAYEEALMYTGQMSIRHFRRCRNFERHPHIRRPVPPGATISI
jgi:fructose 5-dehydrogenase small subunit